MRKNYFVKLLKHINNVYHIEHGINKLSDRRINSKYKTSQIFIPLLRASRSWRPATVRISPAFSTAAIRP